MKVYETQDLILNQLPKRKSTADAEKPFQQVMDEVNAQKGAQGSAAHPAALEFVPEGVQIVGSAERVQMSQVATDKEFVLKELEQTLNLVDFYAAKLADQSFPAGEMDSLVSHLEERMEGLKKVQSAPGVPDGLKSVVSETVLTLARETAKFRRGDYA